MTRRQRDETLEGSARQDRRRRVKEKKARAKSLPIYDKVQYFICKFCIKKVVSMACTLFSTSRNIKPCFHTSI